MAAESTRPITSSPASTPTTIARPSASRQTVARATDPTGGRFPADAPASLFHQGGRFERFERGRGDPLELVDFVGPPRVVFALEKEVAPVVGKNEPVFFEGS